MTDKITEARRVAFEAHMELWNAAIDSACVELRAEVDRLNVELKDANHEAAGWREAATACGGDL